MGDLWTIACGAGFQDGLNPCIMMTCSVFIAFGLWFKKSPSHFWRWQIVFSLVYVLGVLIFNFGPAQVFILQKNFLYAAKIIYFILGIGALILGILFIKDWYSILRGQSVVKRDDEPTKPCAINQLAVYLTAVVLAVVLSALATLWPINNYMMILGNEALLKGQWQTGLPLLGSYVLASMWLLWIVWIVLSIKNLRPSLQKILCASVFITASSSIIFIFR